MSRRMRHPVRTFRAASRKGKVAAAVAAGCLILATGALAFYIVIIGGSGSGTQTLGGAPTGTDATLTVTWPDGLSPGGSVPVDVTAHNTNPGPVQFDGSHLTGTFTSDAPGCDVSAFHYTTDAGGFMTPIPLTGGQTLDFGNVGHLAFTDSGSDQSNCENAHLTLHLTTH